MGLELRQQLKLTQQLIMTPQLQMAIKLLQLSRLELMDNIRQELEENPALEEVSEISQMEQTEETVSQREALDVQEVKEVKIEEDKYNDIDWSNYIEEYNSPGRITFESEHKEATNFEPLLVGKTSLQEHLLWQMLMTSPTEKEELISSLIVGNLNSDGYLEVSVDEIVHQLNSSPEEVEQVLKQMQTFDPVGVCARNLAECLLIQVRHMGIDTPLVIEIIKNHLKELENKNYKQIARATKVSIANVLHSIKIITGLDPRPARQFSDEAPQYITPDIYVYKFENEFVVLVNDDGMPKLRVSSLYRKTIQRGEKLPNKAKEYVQDKMRSAAWLIRSIHQRQKTIYKVMQSILGFQKDFFEKGIAHLKPMILRDVAEDIDMHESTISRVTTNKYVHTPRGIFELKYFFNSSIKRVNGESIASASVQDKIRIIIEKENPRKPYSDEKISKLLEEENINIARRTVAKYREIMKVLPSNKRKQY